MTQTHTPAGSAAGAGAGQFMNDSDQIPENVTWDDIAAVTNRMKDGNVVYEKDVSDTSADFLWEFVAEDNGAITGLIYANGAVALDSNFGWELEFLNQSNSDSRVAYFGIGSGTEATKATDTDTVVAANGSALILNSTHATLRFNKDDVISCTADRDSDPTGHFQLLVSYESEGR